MAKNETRQSATAAGPFQIFTGFPLTHRRIATSHQHADGSIPITLIVASTEIAQLTVIWRIIWTVAIPANKAVRHPTLPPKLAENTKFFLLPPPFDIGFL